MSYWHSRKARLGAIARTIGPRKHTSDVCTAEVLDPDADPIDRNHTADALGLTRLAFPPVVDDSSVPRK